ncbi:ribosomal protein S18 acetylase RimI-like enzyme [Trueperella bonasi]|uniref:Ribosomal protein S18 acetylase RimI-like enzyme n=1 Tax=Trueperella bonasi TaxID=312286 RepID=A0ABT9NIP1_9ACTO|nr:GNAT family N-acetyltransferase [Trueperella bonasi]MDP9807072.1 ribosomal protein S18 acetylase RimI-like enzyme [Trueperella bonasi]
MSISYANVVPAGDDVRNLYNSVGWSAYTNDLPSLMSGLENSTRVVTAWDDEQLVGLARVISDRATIAYLQDILVDPEYQRRGVGRELLHQALEPFNVRQTVLLTDAEPGQRAFYESVGFTEVRDVEPDGLRAFVLLAS